MVSENSERPYDSSVPLEEQLDGCQQVIIRYESKDENIDSFVSEMERLCKSGIGCTVEVNVEHGDSLNGARTKRKVRRLTKDLNLNEAVKLLATLQHKTDKTLEEMSSICLRIR